VSDGLDERLRERLQAAPGFGNCHRCTFLTSGPAELCYACARRTIEDLPPPEQRCATCDRPFSAGESTCRNPLCNWDRRFFKWNFSIAMRSGILERALNAYKYDGRRGWAVIFGRILAGFLQQEDWLRDSFDLITASPTFVGDGGRSFDHTGLVLKNAAEELAPNGSWSFDDPDNPVIVKATPTESFVGKNYAQRREIAESQLRDALVIPGCKSGRWDRNIGRIGCTCRRRAGGSSSGLAGAAIYGRIGISRARSPCASGGC
jgi:predicted amidophosphoribosyltransferase